MRLFSEWIWSGVGEAFTGEIEVEGGRIVALRQARLPGRGRTPTASVVLRDSIVLPGLVNAHTHLDLTFPRPGESLEGSFTDWLLSVRERRMAAGGEGLRAAAARGVAGALAAGTTLLVDYDSGGFSVPALAASPIRRLILREVIAFENDVARRLPDLEEFLDGAEAVDPEREIRGLAPHAPYTVHPELLREVTGLARRRGAPWSMHVAEQPWERELLRSGGGQGAAFLRGLGVSLRDFAAAGLGPVEMLAERGLLDDRPLLVHANHLTDADIEILSGHRAVVVFCPRSHRYFQHPPHPLPRLLEAKVEVILGTDGMISSGDLSMLAEMRAVREAFPGLSAASILEMATGAPRRVLGGSFRCGLLAPGEPADLAVFSLPPGNRTDPLEDLLSAGRPRSTIIDGEPCWSAGGSDSAIQP
ncbi:MAG: amidohydrolase family protein [Planctomycetota bacterium]